MGITLLKVMHKFCKSVNTNLIKLCDSFVPVSLKSQLIRLFLYTVCTFNSWTSQRKKGFLTKRIFSIRELLFKESESFWVSFQEGTQALYLLQYSTQPYQWSKVSTFSELVRITGMLEGSLSSMIIGHFGREGI